MDTLHTVTEYIVTGTPYGIDGEHAEGPDINLWEGQTLTEYVDGEITRRWVGTDSGTPEAVDI
jgi:hypothetical protein